MLNLYRRHLRKCPHHMKGQNYTRCSCPIWCDGELNGRRCRKSLKTRDWSRAVRQIDRWQEKPKEAKTATTISGAVDSYLGDCAARNLKASTISSYRKTFDHLLSFVKNRGVDGVAGIDLGILTDFRAARTVKPSTSRKELQTLRALGAFCAKRKWIEENYAKDLSVPRNDEPPTMPFTDDEAEKIIAACDLIEDPNPRTVAKTRAKAKALVLTMLYSGMRISDTVKLKRSSVDLESGKLLLRIMKTGTPLYVRLGEPATAALAAIPEETEFFFWSGRSKLTAAIGTARRTVQTVLRHANIKGHPHRFRDTFSVSLLAHGEDIRTVQQLLGHTSIKTTERHYAPYVSSFQRILDAATAKLDFGTKSGTRKIHASKLMKLKAQYA